MYIQQKHSPHFPFEPVICAPSPSPFDDNLIYLRSNPPPFVTTAANPILQSVASALRDLEAQITRLRTEWWGGEAWAVRICSESFEVGWR